MNKYTIRVAVLFLLIIGLSVALCLNVFCVFYLCGCKNVDYKCDCNCPNCEANKEEKLDDNKLSHYVLYSDNFKVELDSNGILIASSKGSNGVVLANNIVSAEELTYGQSNICSNIIIAMIDNNGKLSAKDVSNPYCNNANEFSSSDLKDISQLDTLNKKVISVYNERNYSNEFEPYDYHIFAQYEDGSREDITNYFN